MSFDIKRAWANAIQITGNPLAPVLMQEAYSRTEQLGELLVPCADRDKAAEYLKRLTIDFTDEEFNKIAGEPEFIIALASMLSTSLVKLGSSLG